MLDTMKPQYRFNLVTTTGIDKAKIEPAFKEVYRARNLRTAILTLVKNVKALIENPKGEYRADRPKGEYHIARLGNSGWRVDVYGLSISFTWTFDGFF